MREKDRAFFEFLKGSDMDFYEEHLSELTLEELQRFLDDNPDFLKD